MKLIEKILTVLTLGLYLIIKLVKGKKKISIDIDKDGEDDITID